ncbi:MAG: DUF3098 domain-containing protein [Muribaculaceae bacterium]|nr:DUF3098 domain-containing protein [Muribaculaceae bacterium]
MATPYNNRQRNVRKPADAGLEKESPSELPLGKNNFRWMIVAGAMIVLGFLLMLGSGSTTQFNPDIFSARRIVVGPTIAFIGFVVMGIAIIRKPKSGV